MNNKWLSGLLFTLVPKALMLVGFFFISFLFYLISFV